MDSIAPRSISPRGLIYLSLALFSTSTYAQNTKRGLAFLTTHQPDISLLKSPNSTISWYYNWSPYANTAQIPPDALEFVPLIHGLDATDTPRTAEVINSLPHSSQHILSFNEPDGKKDSGGSSISPEDAARAYIEHIVPYRNGENGRRRFNISHPSTTGSPMGLEWLRSFNSSCYDIDPENGCPTDFLATHWYGAFDGLASWLDTLDEFYNGNRSDDQEPLRIWVTEMALPQADVEATVGMMKQALEHLDQHDFVERYAWFGAFRTDDANEWTGDGVALFDGDGGLTDLGAMYLGGEAHGFRRGQKGEGLAAGLEVNCAFVLFLSTIAVAAISYW